MCGVCIIAMHNSIYNTNECIINSDKSCKKPIKCLINVFLTFFGISLNALKIKLFIGVY